MSNDDLVNEAYAYLNKGQVDLSKEILDELKEKDKNI